MLKITERAYEFLERKAKFFSSRNRLPRIILVAKSCQGAKFAMCFDRPDETDTHIGYRDLDILLDPKLIETFGGFELDIEQFFFAPRLLIKPLVDSRSCDCDYKCNNAEV